MRHEKHERLTLVYYTTPQPKHNPTQTATKKRSKKKFDFFVFSLLTYVATYGIIYSAVEIPTKLEIHRNTHTHTHENEGGNPHEAHEVHDLHRNHREPRIIPVHRQSRRPVPPNDSPGDREPAKEGSQRHLQRRQGG